MKARVAAERPEEAVLEDERDHDLANKQQEHERRDGQQEVVHGKRSLQRHRLRRLHILAEPKHDDKVQHEARRKLPGFAQRRGADLELVVVRVLAGEGVIHLVHEPIRELPAEKHARRRTTELKIIFFVCVCFFTCDKAARLSLALALNL